MGGTFDPIHCGHLDVAIAARAAFKLDEVYLVPARVPPHRSAPVASAADRLAMVTLAAGAHDWLRVSEIELAESGPSYTMDTLDRLEAQGTNLEKLHVITGADAFAEILTWKGVPELLNRCSFVVVSRSGFPAPALRRVLPALAHRMVDAKDWDLAARPGIFLLDAPTARVTASEVRAKASSGTSLEGLVPATVASYINRHELYQGVA